MPYYKFANTDVIDYTIKVHPKHEIYVYGSSSFHNNKTVNYASFNNTADPTPGQDLVTHGQLSGSLSLYELNIDRPPASLSYPFITKQGALHAFKTVSQTDFAQFGYGDVMSGTYPLTASVRHEFYPEETVTPTPVRRRVHALVNTLNSYSFFSPVYTASGSNHNLYIDKMNIVSVPSIFYGSCLRKGSVELACYISGSVIGKAKDINKNGELIQYSPEGSPGSGSVVGFVLYNEGIIFLTGSKDLSDGSFTDKYESNTANTGPAWVHWGISPQYNEDEPPDVIQGDLGAGHVSSSWSLNFEGENYIPVKMMFAHAPKNSLNFSSNPTFIKKTDRDASGSISNDFYYKQSEKIGAQNVVSSSFLNHEETFEKQTYISKIGIYDKDRNLIGIAKLATPVRKTENREFVFKLKVDF